MATGLARFWLSPLHVRVPRKIVASICRVRGIHTLFVLVPWPHGAGAQPEFPALVDAGLVDDPRLGRLTVHVTEWRGMRCKQRIPLGRRLVRSLTRRWDE